MSTSTSVATAGVTRGGSEEVVSGFAKAGWPQLLRIALGIAKPLAAIVLIVPGVALVKEWAYACVGVTWIMAFLSAYATGEAATIWAMRCRVSATLNCARFFS